jgi:tetracycline 7-halogenase / FADH2 O2-dependent halogenase
MPDCYRLAAHGRWLAHHPQLRRGLKRGFTYYRHHPGGAPDAGTLGAERLLVAASPDDAVADTHWMRADVDHHFVQEARLAGVDYRDRVILAKAIEHADGVRLSGTRDGVPLELDARFVVDASGPHGFLARQLAIPSALDRTAARSALVFGHFAGVRLMRDVVPGMPDGPYPDDWAAVHHLVDEGWMYSLRFDDGVTSAGFLLTPPGLATLSAGERETPAAMWDALVGRYPVIATAFAGAKPVRPIAFVPEVQHRLARAAGARWALLPHTFAFVDPLFSTGIAWGLRGVERLALAFEEAADGARVPDSAALERYDGLLAAEADQVDRLVAGAYAANTHFDLFAAQAMLYFATVSFAEVRQRIAGDAAAAWSGFLGVGDDVLEPVFGEALTRLREITGGRVDPGTAAMRRSFEEWVARVIAPRNVAGLADPARENRYPVDLDTLVDRHALLGMTRQQLIDALPALRGMSPEPPLGGTIARARAEAGR